MVQFSYVFSYGSSYSPNKIVCSQVEDFMEKNRLIPETQHGFRANRSTQKEWSQIQQVWANDTEKKKITGVLMWDLTAAFDTLDHNILLSQLEIYGFNSTAIEWMKSYLTGRSQRTKIGNKLSELVKLSSGVPQGGNFSPLAFVIYVSDLEDWLQFAKALTYADDAITSVSADNKKKFVKNLPT